MDSPIKNRTKKKTAIKKNPRQKPLSLHGLSFDDVVKRVAQGKPPKKSKKSG